MKANSLALFAAMIVLGALAALAQKPPKVWIDEPVKQWNKPGASIPHAQRFYRDAGEIPPLCKSSPRQPKTAEERAVAAAGWMIFGTFDSRSRSNIGADRDRIVVIGAMANMDGMCRPDMYQDFVFVDGTYAGSLSPKQMNARSDASAASIDFPAPGALLVEFVRYDDKDPLCCPSRISSAAFEIQRRDTKPVVAWISVKTRPAER